MSYRKSLLPKKIQSVQFNIPSSLDDYELPSSHEEEKYSKPSYQPVTEFVPSSRGAYPIIAPPPQEYQPSTSYSQTQEYPLGFIKQEPEEQRFADFFNVEMTTGPLPPAPIPVPAPAPEADVSEWQSLLNQMRSGNVAVKTSGFSDMDFNFMVFYANQKVHSNNNALSIFLDFIKTECDKLSPDGSDISKLLFFISNLYENYIFNTLIKYIFKATDEYVVDLDKNFHHGVFVSKEYGNNYAVSVYHHLSAILASSHFGSEEEKRNVITLMRLAIGMNEIFNQLHIMHLKIQSLLTSALYFGPDSFEPAAGMLPLFNFMRTISELNEQVEDDYGQITPVLFNLLQSIKHQEKEFDAANNDIRITSYLDVSSTVDTNTFVSQMKEHLIHVFSDMERYLMKY